MKKRGQPVKVAVTAMTLLTVRAAQAQAPAPEAPPQPASAESPQEEAPASEEAPSSETTTPPSPSPAPVPVIPTPVPLPVPAPAPTTTAPSTVAGPPPAWPPAPAATQGPYVHVEADDPAVQLERHDGPHDLRDRGWYPVCNLPCDRPIAAPTGTDFRFGGPGVKSSGKFRLGRERYVAFDVEAGSQAQWVGGWVAVGVGGTSLVLGAGLIATTVDGFLFDTPESVHTRRVVGGVMVGAGIAVGVGLGLPLLLTSRTTYEIIDQRAYLELTPDGVAVTF